MSDEMPSNLDSMPTVPRRFGKKRRAWVVVLAMAVVLAGGCSGGGGEARQDAAPPEAGDECVVTLPGGATMTMVWCPPGEFIMGSPEEEPGRFGNETQHRVKLTEGFWMAKTEVTQKQWQSVMGNNPSRWKDDDLPVECVSWEDCKEFCKKAGNGLRLPTEAEWEYACRAGSTTALPNGDIRILGECNAPALDPIAWYSGNSSVGWSGCNGVDSSGWADKQYPGGEAGTHPVGQKRANSWGLHDMIGNVLEWCEDWYQEDLGHVVVTDPMSPASGADRADRVLRGGSWGHGARFCRSADRYFYDSAFRSRDGGFRPCSSASKTALGNSR